MKWLKNSDKEKKKVYIASTQKEQIPSGNMETQRNEEYQNW